MARSISIVCRAVSRADLFVWCTARPANPSVATRNSKPTRQPPHRAGTCGRLRPSRARVARVSKSSPLKSPPPSYAGRPHRVSVASTVPSNLIVRPDLCRRHRPSRNSVRALRRCGTGDRKYRPVCVVAATFPLARLQIRSPRQRPDQVGAPTQEGRGRCRGSPGRCHRCSSPTSSTPGRRQGWHHLRRPPGL